MKPYKSKINKIRSFALALIFLVLLSCTEAFSLKTARY